MKKLTLSCSLILTTCLFSSLGLAHPSQILPPVPSKKENCQTLQAIKDRGRLIIGVYEDEPYFGQFNPLTEKIEGFEVDLARELALDLLGDPNRLELIVVTPKDRIPYLQEGKVDLILAQLSVTEDRKKILDLSDIYYLAGQSILVKVNSPIKSLRDLEGRTIGVVSGSTTSINVKKVIPKAHLAFLESASQAFQALIKGQIDAMAFDDVTLLALREDNEAFLRGYKFIGGEMSWEPYAIGVKKGCGDVLHFVNEALRRIKTDGRWQQMYDKHIKSVSQVSAKPPE